MESSSLFLSGLLTTHEPSGWKRLVPATGGRAVPTPRFMGSLHDFRIAHWDYEPAGRSADRRVRAFQRPGSRGLGGPRSGRRFMERSPLC